MNPVEKFLLINRIKKKDLAEYLGVSNAFVTQLVSGARPIPDEKLKQILSNGSWDVSMLTYSSMVSGDHIEQNGGRGNIGKIAGDSGEVLSLRKENEMLRAQVEELKALSNKYWNMIEILTQTKNQTL